MMWKTPELDPYAKRLGEQIAAARRARGWTQRQLSEYLGLGRKPGKNQSLVSTWETGGATPSVDRIDDVCSLLGLDLEEAVSLCVDSDHPGLRRTVASLVVREIINRIAAGNARITDRERERIDAYAARVTAALQPEEHAQGRRRSAGKVARRES